MEQPRYFLNVCDSVLSWIDEGKLPEQNAAGLKDGSLLQTGSFASLPYGTFGIFSFFFLKEWGSQILLSNNRS